MIIWRFFSCNMLFTVMAWIISNTDLPTPRYLSARDQMLRSFIREVSGLRVDWVLVMYRSVGHLPKSTGPLNACNNGRHENGIKGIVSQPTKNHCEASVSIDKG